MTILIRGVVSKFEFRKLFTLAERVAIDNFSSNSELTQEQKSQMNTLTKDFDAATIINLDDPAVLAALLYMESIGLLAVGRSEQIVSRLSPA